MVSKVRSSILIGVDAYPIDVEAQIFGSLKRFSIVGLPDGTVREARERVRCAIENSGFAFPTRELIVSLGPAGLPKFGAGFDLAIALAILGADGQLTPDAAQRLIVLGELALDGRIKVTPGALSTAIMARQKGVKEVLVPEKCATHAALLPGICIYGAKTLAEVVRFLREEIVLSPAQPIALAPAKDPREISFGDVFGQHAAKRALEIVAAGGHNLLMVGPPGAGKTMLAKCLLSIMPELDPLEAIEVIRIHSTLEGRTTGISPSSEACLARPFRAPHHSISVAGLVGGGPDPVPGEISLAHKGILFLDEFTEFRRDVLESLRQPIEARQVCISRARLRVNFPSDFSLVAAMNPCPCGKKGNGTNACECTPAATRKYRQRISGPILDRIDLRIWVPALSPKDFGSTTSIDPTEQMRSRVNAARQVQHARLKSSCLINARLRPKELRKFCSLSASADRLATSALEKYKLSARGYSRLLKVSRTIADLEAVEVLQDRHVAEALSYRMEDF